MADPFSIVSGALSVADISIRVGKYLKTIQQTSKHVSEEITSLEREIETFTNTYNALAALCCAGTTHEKDGVHAIAVQGDPCGDLWQHAAELVNEGQTLIEQLKSILEKVLGSELTPKHQKIDDVRKAIRLSSRSVDYGMLRGRFTKLNMELNTMFTAIELASSTLFRTQALSSLEQLPSHFDKRLQEMAWQLNEKLDALEKAGADSKPSVDAAKAAIGFASLNEHFHIQKVVTNVWTGRQSHLDELRDAFLDAQPSGDRVQRRFVVHGMSGAGKTQFACKFAQDYRESFWAVFWVDASTDQNASESWKRIARLGGKDPNEEAGKYWLSNLQSPWLLIVDNAQGSDEAVRSNFPIGERGCILITTLNPRLRMCATVGSLALDRLEEIEAVELLRKATDHQPWDSLAEASAIAIAQHLGFLPLALIHAGRNIQNRYSTIHNYVAHLNQKIDDYHNRNRRQIPETREAYNDDDDNDTVGVFTSFDMLYSGVEERICRERSSASVSQDAIELVSIFAFLHHNDIKIDIITKAARNLLQAAATGPTAEDVVEPVPSLSITQRLAAFAQSLYIKLTRSAPVYPGILRAVDDQSVIASRTMKAMNLLVKNSMLFESSERGSYSMHPLVHTWLRKRLCLPAQALWCGVAADVVASCIKLPPMADETGDQDLYVRLLPHIHMIRANKKQISEGLQQKSLEAPWPRKLLWQSRPPSFTDLDAANSARYSRVYMECFQLDEAESLQQRVRAYVLQRVGSDHPMSVVISMVLAKTLWILARAAEAQELQEDALRVCRLRFGEKHSRTLKVMDALGETYWQRGWLKQSKALHQSAIDGMEGRPNLNRERLNAITHLGHVHEWYTENQRAIDLHEIASNGLTEAYGPDDFDTLVAKDSLAMTLLRPGPTMNSRRAYNLMQDVYDRRRKTLGEEHLFTLWAACNLARTLTIRGSLEEDNVLLDQAKSIFRDGLAISRRNLGVEHLGTLMGRSFLADVWVVEKQYNRAEEEYQEVAELQRHLPGSRAGTHRDRMVTLEKLIDLYEVQNRLDMAIEHCDIIVRELDGLGGQEHPYRMQVLERQAKLKARLDRLGQTEEKQDVQLAHFAT